jgi:hypothetical protein
MIFIQLYIQFIISYIFLIFKFTKHENDGEYCKLHIGNSIKMVLIELERRESRKIARKVFHHTTRKEKPNYHLLVPS